MRNRSGRGEQRREASGEARAESEQPGLLELQRLLENGLISRATAMEHIHMTADALTNWERNTVYPGKGDHTAWHTLGYWKEKDPPMEPEERTALNRRNRITEAITQAIVSRDTKRIERAQRLWPDEFARVAKMHLQGRTPGHDRLAGPLPEDQEQFFAGTCARCRLRERARDSIFCKQCAVTFTNITEA